MSYPSKSPQKDNQQQNNQISSSAELSNAYQTIAELNAKIAVMESSGFWRLRSLFIRFFYLFGLNEQSAWLIYHNEGKFALLKTMLSNLFSAKKAVPPPTDNAEKEKVNIYSINDFLFLKHSRELLTTISTISLQHFFNRNIKIDFPVHQNPQLSIILILYNRAELTYQLFNSILGSKLSSYEIIIIDNASSDQTPEFLSRLNGPKIVINQTNLHFLRAVNQAAKMAQGEYLLLLNNDTILFPDSINNALHTITHEENIGALGGKLLFPNNRLQEAGLRIQPDGNGFPIGRGDYADNEQYSRLADVDYCSGAFLLTPRELFLSMNGFDEDYVPAYYEDVDYCVRLKKQGKRVVYDPTVQLYHYENASIKTPLEVYQLTTRNREIFVNKHREWLLKNCHY